MTVLAVNNWKTNGELIADVAKLYLTEDMSVLDPTYGHGTWWTHYKPKRLIASDLDVAKSPWGRSIDFVALPWAAYMFDCIAFDPPYKLNGTPDPTVDFRYGVGQITPWQERMELIEDGMEECSRVLKTGGIFLLKCMDQVCSGEIRWQTDQFTSFGEISCKLRKIDRFDMIGQHRKQPMEGREQRHAHGRGSTLLVFRKQ